MASFRASSFASLVGAALVAAVACSASPQGHGSTTATSASTSAGSGGHGGAGITSATTGSTGGGISIGSGGAIVTGSTGTGAGMTCTPAMTAPPGDCASMGITIAPQFASSYTCVDLGTVASVPSPWGGFAMSVNDTSALLVTGSARSPGGELYSVPIGRDADCHVAGFLGTSTDVASAPYNEAGVAFGPSGVLFLAQAIINKMGELKPGSMAPDKTVDMGALGFAQTMCGVGFVPTGFPGAGQLKLINWPSPGYWYNAPLMPDGAGTFDVTSLVQGAMLPNGAAGFVFIAAGNPGFSSNTVLVSEYDIGTVAAYTLTGPASDPDPTTRTPFITGLTGAQGGVLDPVSGDFLFSTYSTAQIIAIRGFKPPPPPPT
jgi:hypothetical protein